MEESGDRLVRIITGKNESSEMLRQPIESDGGMRVALGYSDISIDDAIQMHLVDCNQCRTATTQSRPVGVGQRSGHCGTYWEMQLARAKYEGIVNNIGHVTEDGNEAPVIGRLEP